jgi:hypothetical protein
MLMLLAEKWTPNSAGIAYLRGSKLRSTCGDGRLARPVEQSETPDPYGQPPPIAAAIANVGATDASHEQRGEVRSRGFSADRRSHQRNLLRIDGPQRVHTGCDGGRGCGTVFKIGP